MSTRALNGALPKDARSAAELYLARGLAPIPLPARSKGEGLKEGWQRLRLTWDMLDAHFPSAGALNIGVLNGAPSGNILDVDLDCHEAVDAAPHLLPATELRFGRRSAPRSHWLYRADRPLDKASAEHKD